MPMNWMEILNSQIYKQFGWGSLLNLAENEKPITVLSTLDVLDKLSKCRSFFMWTARIFLATKATISALLFKHDRLWGLRVLVFFHVEVVVEPIGVSAILGERVEPKGRDLCPPRRFRCFSFELWPTVFSNLEIKSNFGVDGLKKTFETKTFWLPQ